MSLAICPPPMQNVANPAHPTTGNQEMASYPTISTKPPPSSRGFAWLPTTSKQFPRCIPTYAPAIIRHGPWYNFRPPDFEILQGSASTGGLEGYGHRMMNALVFVLKERLQRIAPQGRDSQ